MGVMATPFRTSPNVISSNRIFFQWDAFIGKNLYSMCKIDSLPTGLQAEKTAVLGVFALKLEHVFFFHWSDYYTSLQRFIITISYLMVVCPNVSTSNCNLQKW